MGHHLRCERRTSYATHTTYATAVFGRVLCRADSDSNIGRALASVKRKMNDTKWPHELPFNAKSAEARTDEMTWSSFLASSAILCGLCVRKPAVVLAHFPRVAGAQQRREIGLGLLLEREEPLLVHHPLIARGVCTAPQ